MERRSVFVLSRVRCDWLAAFQLHLGIAFVVVDEELLDGRWRYKMCLPVVFRPGLQSFPYRERTAVSLHC